jgi:hypothetical protein
MSLKKMGRTGRDIIWSKKGIRECGGGFLGIFLMKLISKSEEKLEREEKRKSKKEDFIDKLLSLFD